MVARETLARAATSRTVVPSMPRSATRAVAAARMRALVASASAAIDALMPDDDFATMSADLTLGGDEGYPMVFAYEGQVFDNARIRVKGQVSRTFPKKKFKIILPQRPRDVFGLQFSPRTDCRRPSRAVDSA